MARILDWFRERKARKKSKEMTERLAQLIAVWMMENSKASLEDFITMMAGIGFDVSGYSLAGDEIVFDDYNGFSINVHLGVKDVAESDNDL